MVLQTDESNHNSTREKELIEANSAMKEEVFRTLSVFLQLLTSANNNAVI